VKHIFKTDWLNSNPVFYNQKTKKISHNINDVIDFKNLEFHPEGLNNYLDFGYSVFGQTPIKEVKFLRHSSEIYIKKGELIINEKDDPVIDWFKKNKPSTPEQVLQKFKESVNKLQQSETLVIIPTSGGMDSRMLNYFVKDKKKIKAFTYGVSNNQSDSYEVTYAKHLCNTLGIEWKHIQLDNYMKHIDEWYALYGISTHAHGMYHIEFYNKINKHIPNNTLLLTGIVGDAWAGSIKYFNLNNYQDVKKLGYSHELNSSREYSLIKSDNELMKNYYNKNLEKINNKKIQAVEVIRHKMILLSYLIKIPQSKGFRVKSPFLDMDIALSMVNLDQSIRENRNWQRDFFKKIGLDIENQVKGVNKSLFLENKIIRQTEFKKLDQKLLGEIIKVDYIDWINKLLTKPDLFSKIYFNLDKFPFGHTYIFYFKRILAKFFKFDDKILKAYHAYLVLKPLENVIKKRNNER
jgi:hypothetical protein